jgi:hypothetical protein
MRRPVAAREKIDKRLADWWEQEKKREDALPANQ